MGLPDLGVGVGLRVPHVRRVLEETPAVDWFEVVAENFMVEGGRPVRNLDAVLSRYRVVPHGVSMGIGSEEPPDRTYLRRLADLVRRTGTPWASDHFCWNRVGGSGGLRVHLHDLLPLPYTKAMVARVADRVREVEDALGVPFVLENVSSYLTWRASTMPEWEFVAAVCDRADCGLLLDVNNVYVSAHNHGFDPRAYLAAIDPRRVVQIHLAGHTTRDRFKLDTHSCRVCDDVWDLYRVACERCGDVSTLVEWDDHIPELEVLLAEAEKARALRDEARRARPGAAPAVHADA